MSHNITAGGYPTVSPYLTVNGAGHTLVFLEKLLGATARLVHRDDHARVLHAEVVIGDSLVMLADAQPGWPAREGHIHVYVPDVDAAYHRALELGADSVQAPVKKDDPDRRAGVRDSGGTTWWLATPQEDPAPVDLRPFIRTVMDFPRPGIGFKDITPLLADAAAFSACVDQLADAVSPESYDRIAGIESRGFLFGAALALRTGKPFIPLRKPGKLPWACRRVEYALEYGTDALEIHEDSCGPGDRVLLLDDLLATGGTVKAAARLVHELGASVTAALFVIELGFLPGRKALEKDGVAVHSLLAYNGEES